MAEPAVPVDLSATAAMGASAEMEPQAQMDL
jgi:hypothetical protein